MVQCKTALYLRAGYLRASLLLALGLGTLSLQSQLQAEEPPAQFAGSDNACFDSTSRKGGVVYDAYLSP